MEEAEAALWSEAGRRALEWLRSRGLAEETIRAWRLGYNSQTRRATWGGKAVSLWRGIIIPAWPDQLRAVKIRRPAGEPKYAAVRGSRLWLFGAETFTFCLQAFLFESELDALLAWQHWPGEGLNGERGLGFGALPAGQTLRPEWAGYFRHLERLIVAFDDDDAGRKGAEKLCRLSPAIVRASDFGGAKDLGEYAQRGGDVFNWLWRALEEAG